MNRSLHWGLVSKYRTEIMGLACLWVVLHHYTNNMIFPSVLRPMYRLAVYGNAGVDVFLFLSGIGLYFAFQKGVTLRDFYKKRIVRLLIPYLLLCVPYYAWVALYLKEGNFWLNVTQLSFPLSHMITTWYVPAMLVFYLLFPLVYWILNHHRIQNKTAWVISLSGIYAVFLLVFKNLFPVLYENIEIAMVRFLIFFVGCYFGRVVYEKRELTATGVSLSAVFVLLLILLRETTSLSAYWIRLSYAPLAIALCVLATWLFSKCKDANPILKVLRFFGNRSLEIYLTHVMFNRIWVSTVGSQHFDSYGAVDYLIIVSVSVAVSVVAHEIIQKLSTLILRERKGAKS